MLNNGHCITQLGNWGVRKSLAGAGKNSGGGPSGQCPTEALEILLFTVTAASRLSLYRNTAIPNHFCLLKITDPKSSYCRGTQTSNHPIDSPIMKGIKFAWDLLLVCFVNAMECSVSIFQ